MALYEEDMMEDLAYDEAEGPAEAYDEGFDEFDEGDEEDEYEEGEEFDEVDEGDELEAMEAYDEGDELDEMDEGEELEEESEHSLESAMAYALAAEDTDEFFRRIGRVARRVAGAVRRAAPIVGRIARVAAPILRVIPHPAAQIGARAASVLGRLRMEGASEEDALEAFAEIAARNPRAAPLPLVAGIAARALVRRAGAAMPPAARRQVVQRVQRAARTLVSRQGTAAIRALPRIVRSVRRTAAVRGTPPVVRPRVALNTARRVAANPGLARRLARPSPRARAIVRRVAGGAGMAARPGLRPPIGGFGGRRRSFIVRGPVRITRLRA